MEAVREMGSADRGRVEGCGWWRVVEGRGVAGRENGWRDGGLGRRAPFCPRRPPNPLP